MNQQLYSQELWMTSLKLTSCEPLSCLTQCRIMITQAFLGRFEALPAIKAYMSSAEFMKWPVNNKIAKWGGAGSS